MVASLEASVGGVEALLDDDAATGFLAGVVLGFGTLDIVAAVGTLLA